MNVAVAIAPVSVKPATALDTSNLLIDEIISHRVYAKDAKKVVKPPHLQDELMVLPGEGVDALQQRLTKAFGSRSHGIELSIERDDAGSFMQLGAHAIALLPKADFISASKTMAINLSTAQASTTGLSGIVFVIRGRMGAASKRFVSVIKAELHDGFGSSDDAEDAAFKYLKNLALTPSQRLYKVGLLLEEKAVPATVLGDYSRGNYRGFLFDHLITATETRSAAAYFYQAFLGMGIQKSSKKLTQDFYENVRTFIASSPLSEDQRWELKEALRVELRSTSTVISASDFADDNMPTEQLRDSFLDFMDARSFPKAAIAKDVEFVKSKLRRPRKLSFTSGVKIIIPPDSEKCVVEVVDQNDEQATIVVRGTFHEE